MRQLLLRIGLGFFAILAFLYGFVMLRSIIPTTVNDGDLRLARASIPEGANAFDVLQIASSHLWWPDDQSLQLSDLARDTNWNAGLADKVLANNREALAGWDAAAKMPDLQVPEVTNCEDLLPYLPGWKKMAQLASIRENVLLRSGQDKEAFDQMVDQVELGRRMQNARGVLIVYLVGMAVNNMGLNQMQRSVAKAHLDPLQMNDYVRQLEPQPNEEAIAFANSARADYHSTIGTVDAFRQGKIHDLDTGGNYPRPQLSRSVLPVFSFSKTKALFARPYLAMVKAASHHYNEVKLPDLESQPGKISLVLSGNVGGQLLYDLIAPAVESCLFKKSQSDVQLQATRVILALRAFQLAHGKLPSDLNALVPEFLDAVPADDFDGQPLRYVPDRKIVYSVGENLKDDGGDDSRGGRSSRQLDLVYKFDF